MGLGTDFDVGFLVLLPLLGLTGRTGETHRRLFEITLRWGARNEPLEVGLVPTPPKLVLVGILRLLLVVFSVVEPEAEDLIFLTLVEVAPPDTPPEELLLTETTVVLLAELFFLVDTTGTAGRVTLRDDDDSGCGTGFRGTTALLEPLWSFLLRTSTATELVNLTAPLVHPSSSWLQYA